MAAGNAKKPPSDFRRLIMHLQAQQAEFGHWCPHDRLFCMYILEHVCS